MTPDEIQESTTDQLLEHLLDLNYDITNIKQQLLDYTLGERPPDTKWYSKATYARKMLALEYMEINTELSKRKKAAAKEFSQCFITVAKEELSEELFHTIFNKAKEASIC